MDRIEAVRTFIVETFLFGDASRIPDTSSSFLENGIVDSTGMLEVINFIEERFGITVADVELLPENLDSLDNIDRFIAVKTAAGKN